MFGSGRSDTLVRSRWAAIGAAVAVALGAGGAGWVANAASTTPTRPSLFVAITPCRLIDTHATSGAAFLRHTPIGPGGTYTAAAWGTRGRCKLPSSAVSLVTNVTIDGPTAASVLTVFPGGTTRPVTASMRWLAKQGPTSNSVTTALSSTGTVAFWNSAGTVNIAVDVVGFYQADTLVGGARAYGHVSAVQALTQSKNALSVTLLGPGEVCIELPPSINVLTATATVTMDFAGDGTNVNQIAGGERNGVCGVNGIDVVTYLASLAGNSAPRTLQPFYFTVA